jgi:multiple sugar transport system permease protein
MWVSACHWECSGVLNVYLLNTRIFGRPFFERSSLPAIVPVVVVAMVWGFLLNAQFGIINATLRGLGLPVINFLTNPDLAKPSMILIYIWAQGYAIVIFLATLQDVPRPLYEAATVDGANNWQKFWNITIPMCTPVILFNLVTGFIYAFQEFTLPWLITAWRPNQATEFYACIFTAMPLFSCGWENVSLDIIYYYLDLYIYPV